MSFRQRNQSVMVPRTAMNRAVSMNTRSLGVMAEVHVVAGRHFGHEVRHSGLGQFTIMAAVLSVVDGGVWWWRAPDYDDGNVMMMKGTEVR